MTIIHIRATLWKTRFQHDSFVENMKPPLEHIKPPHDQTHTTEKPVFNMTAPLQIIKLRLFNTLTPFYTMYGWTAMH
jgi:hypothetical protein